MIPDKQVAEIKEKLISHLNSTLPNDKKALVTHQIQNMSNEQLEAFLIQNKMISQTESAPPAPEQESSQCIFCSIIQGKIPSYRIDENKDAIAALEINPISKGHVLIIPKKHIETEDKLPQSAFSMAKRISKKLKTRFKPKEVKMLFSNVLGHEIINLLPVYENESLSSPRKQLEDNALEKLKKSLEKKTKPKTSKKKTVKKSKKTQPKKERKEMAWLPKRIP
jgi:histidine triad (HIT) family protein